MPQQIIYKDPHEDVSHHMVRLSVCIKINVFSLRLLDCDGTRQMIMIWSQETNYIKGLLFSGNTGAYAYAPRSKVETGDRNMNVVSWSLMHIFLWMCSELDLP